jgi:hypothetical protein
MFTTTLTAIRKIIVPGFAAIALALPLAAPLSGTAFAARHDASQSRDHNSGKDHSTKNDRGSKDGNSVKDNSGKDLSSKDSNSIKDNAGRDSSKDSGWDMGFDG